MSEIGEKEDHIEISPELTEADKVHITEVFVDEIIPKLQFMNARTGVLNCEFAGEKYKNWSIVFKEVGSDFEILKFEYEEEGRGITYYD
jgi:hypothetical protein